MAFAGLRAPPGGCSSNLRFEAEQCAFLFALDERARTADEAEAMRKEIFDAATAAH
jgi:hypothetical protein